MKINRLNLLARQGHLQFAEEPAAGDGGSTNDDQKGASDAGADGDKSGGDSGDDSGDGDG